MDILKKIAHVLSVVKSLFLSGLFTIIPIAATLFFISFMYGLISRCIKPIYELEPVFLKAIPGFEFIIVTVFIIGLGVILKGFLIHRVVHYVDALLARIPFIRIVYSSSKILVDFFKMPNSKEAIKRKVVLIPYPKKGQYHLAFLLEDAVDSYEKIIPDDFRNFPGERYVKIFMPHSPNPTSGFFFIMAEDEIIHTDISFEEAIKTLVSCGLITPESLKKMPYLKQP